MVEQVLEGPDAGSESIVAARLVVERLIAHGVIDVVLAPGSRSTPLALVLAAAERASQLVLHVRVDERCAGFLALGLAKESGSPVAVICTSGSAVANLAPAVVEARYSGLPLIVITADRPPELRGVGSNQTIDQIGFFGQQVRTAIDFMAVAGDSRGVEGHRQIVDGILADAIGVGCDSAAPVHLNIAFREPLVPQDNDWLDVTVTASESVPMATEIREPINYAVGDIGLAHVPARGLVIVGDVGNRSATQQAVELATACGWPIISEPSGNALGGPTSIPAASVVLRDESFRHSHRPELVVTIGRFGISRPIMRIVAESSRHIAVYTGGKDRPDPLRSASAVLDAVPGLPDPASQIPLEPASDSWLRDWLTASSAATARVSSVLDQGPLTGLSVSAECWRASEADDVLFVAASRAVRNLETTMDNRQYAPRVLGNRGASGIDGLISTAWGVAVSLSREHPRGRTLALLGDLAFIHDHNGLLTPKSEALPNLTIVVVDNNGGGIFSSLEQGQPQFALGFERVFGTPHNLDLASIARATGIPTRVVMTKSALTEALADRSPSAQIVIATAISRSVEEAEQQLLHIP